MARQAVACGTTHVVVTPHYLPGVFEPDPALIRALTAEFRRRLEEARIGLVVLEGCEVALSPEVPHLLAGGRLMTLGDRGAHLLVELPVTDFPRWTEEVLFQVRLLGAVPVLAHPERNRVLREKPDLLGNLVRQGVLVQVEAGSITGLHGRRLAVVAERWVRQGWAHMLGSDAHGTSGPRTPALLRKALTRLGRSGAALACPPIELSAISTERRIPPELGRRLGHGAEAWGCERRWGPGGGYRDLRQRERGRCSQERRG